MKEKMVSQDRFSAHDVAGISPFGETHTDSNGDHTDSSGVRTG
jgi:hypothetical protein